MFLGNQEKKTQTRGQLFCPQMFLYTAFLYVATKLSTGQ